MAVDFGGVKMQNPINTAAGTFGYGWQFQNFFDVSQLGAITTKGCAAEPWPGNPAPRMAEIPGGMINSVGLQNPGVAAFARESGPWLEQLSKDGCQVICQVAGHSVDEFVRALEMYVELCPWAAGYEINVSCPNIAAGGAAMGSTPEGASSVMAACRKVTDKPLFVKMAPVNVAEIAKALEAAGADGLSVINSIQGMAIDVHTRKSRVAKPKGGLSGPLCHHIAVRMVWEVAQAVDIPINGVGGVMTGEDAAEFILAGATCVSVGMANFVDPCASLKIAHELEAWGARRSRAALCGVRKVRAPKGKMPANGWAGRPDGKCHRKVNSPAQAGEKLKRCGKSAPARWQQRGLENPIWSKRK